MEDVIGKRNKKIYNSLYYDTNEKLTFEVLSKTIVFKKIIKKLDFKNKNILEIGFGSGSLIETILKKKGNYFGLEISDSAISTIKDIYDSSIKVDKIMNNKIIYPNNFFDIIIMSHSLEHIEQETIIINECKRTLKTGGIIIIGVPSKFCKDNRLHYRTYNREEIIKLSNRNDLIIKNIFFFKGIPFLNRKNKHSKIKDSENLLNKVIKEIYYKIITPLLS